MTFKLSQGLADLKHKKYLETEVAYGLEQDTPGGTLNPTYGVEWLMGYDVAGYTDLKDCGNSIIPQIAQEIGNAIITAERRRKKERMSP